MWIREYTINYTKPDHNGDSMTIITDDMDMRPGILTTSNGWKNRTHVTITPQMIMETTMETKTFVETRCITCNEYHEVPLDPSAIDMLGQPYGVCSKCYKPNTKVYYYDDD